jgi:DNA-directed RNA polymerase subunit beta'
VGLYDPEDVKLKNKSVKGLLKWALGTSPKRSAFATKVLGSTVDTVGRGVIVPSTKLRLNEIGMPVDMAWDVYAPFVVRKLVQRNYTPVDAMKMVK